MKLLMAYLAILVSGAFILYHLNFAFWWGIYYLAAPHFSWNL